MKTDNLEMELRRYELSQANDKITYEKHYYNDFSGMEGEEAYRQYLQRLYDTYFIELRRKIDTLALSSIDTLLKFIQTKIDLFNEIIDRENNNTTRWIDYEMFKGLIIRDKTIDKSIIRKSQAARNQYNTMKFFVRMMEVQFYFNDKAINELTEIYNIYSPQPQPQKITENDIDKDSWDNTLKDEKDILETSDLARIFNRDDRTINRWARDGVINPIDKHKRPQQFRKDDVKKYYLKIKR